MASLVPVQGEPFGQLTIEEVFFEHDGPRFFIARSQSDRRFLVIAVDETETSDTYLYLPISDARWTAVRSGLMTVRTAFQEPEDGSLYAVVANYEAEPNNVIAIRQPGEVPDHWWPDADSVLELRTPTRPPFDSSLPGREAQAQQRTFIALEVEPPRLTRTEYPLRSLARLAGAVQDVVDALAQEADGHPTPRGPIQSQVLQDAELAFNYALAASFVVVLAGNRGDRLFESPIMAQACQSLTALLAATDDDASLRDTINTYGPRARSKYRAFLEMLSDDETGVRVVIGQANGQTQDTSLSARDVRGAVSLLRTSDTEVRLHSLERVTITGVNLRTGAFEIVDLAAAHTYAGKMEPEARTDIEGLATGDANFYRAEVSAEDEVNSVTGTVATTYRLLTITARE